MRPLLALVSLAFILVCVTCDDNIGTCGTQPGWTYQFLDDAESPFCFKFTNAATGSEPYTYFYYFGTRVDTYTLVQLQGSNLNEEADSSNQTVYWRAGEDVKVQLEAGGVNSTKTMYARKFVDGQLWIFTQLSVVIVVDEGKVTEVLWDDGCYACDADHCIDGNCAITPAECNDGDDTDCDFSAYVSWYGTDKNSRYLLSAGQRLSQFGDTTASSYYSYVKDQLDNDFVQFNDQS